MNNKLDKMINGMDLAQLAELLRVAGDRLNVMANDLKSEEHPTFIVHKVSSASEDINAIASDLYEYFGDV